MRYIKHGKLLSLLVFLFLIISIIGSPLLAIYIFVIAACIAGVAITWYKVCLFFFSKRRLSFLLTLLVGVFAIHSGHITEFFLFYGIMIFPFLALFIFSDRNENVRSVVEDYDGLHNRGEELYYNVSLERPYDPNSPIRDD